MLKRAGVHSAAVDELLDEGLRRPYTHHPDFALSAVTQRVC